MKKKCPRCRLVNYPTAETCVRCSAALPAGSGTATGRRRSASAIVVRRAVVCILVCISGLAGFYVSLVVSAKPLAYEDRKSVEAAIAMLSARGFSHEAMLLRRIAVFRSTDNWLNASVAKENAFAATNFPFAVVTLYPDFFTYTADDLERAAILLHEAKHMEGADEKEAYEFVWKNREQLGWTLENYGNSVAWIEIRNQTRDQVPVLFVCEKNPFGDCTED